MWTDETDKTEHTQRYRVSTLAADTIPRWSQFGLFQRDQSSFGMFIYVQKMLTNQGLSLFWGLKGIKCENVNGIDPRMRWWWFSDRSLNQETALTRHHFSLEKEKDVWLSSVTFVAADGLQFNLVVTVNTEGEGWGGWFEEDGGQC